MRINEGNEEKVLEETEGGMRVVEMGEEEEVKEEYADASRIVRFNS